MPYVPGVPQNPQAALDFYAALVQKDPTNAEAFFDLGQLLLNSCNDSTLPQGVFCLHKALQLKQDWPFKYPEWAQVFRTIGNYQLHKEFQFEKGMETIALGLAIQDELAQRHPLSKLNFRILANNNNPQHIGHAAMESEVFVKAGILGLRKPFTGVLCTPGHVANPCLLSYWSDYYCVVQDPESIQALLPLSKHLRYDTWYHRFPDGRARTSVEALAEIENLWRDQNRPPLFTLRASDHARGQETMERLGVPRGSWFVAVHVREPGFYGETGASQTGAFRNADIETYCDAMREITSRGGWVVRLGDPTMKRLPQLHQVIDYAHSPFKSDWMDIFLCAQCRFFLGTTSGLLSVPGLFGVPCAITNFWAILGLPARPDDLFIFKLPWNLQEKRYFHWREVTSLPMALAQDDTLRTLDFSPIDNTPDEIRDLAVEMLDRCEGKLAYSPEDDALQGVARRYLNSKYLTKSRARLGREFLRKYIDLFRG